MISSAMTFIAYLCSAFRRSLSGLDCRKLKKGRDLEQMPGVAIETVEMHTGGEPVRIITSGYPPVNGASILEKRRYAREHLDHLRRMLIFEPRGHKDMYGVIPVEPDDERADLAVLFMHNEGYSTMCGHAVIALSRWAIDSGIVEPAGDPTVVRIQCPCGLVTARVAIDITADGKVRTGDVSFESVPAFAHSLDAVLEVPDYGQVTLDIGYGGAFYAILPAVSVGLDVRRSPIRDLVDAGDEVQQRGLARAAGAHQGNKLTFVDGQIHFAQGRDRFTAVAPEAGNAGRCHILGAQKNGKRRRAVATATPIRSQTIGSNR